MLQSDYKVLSEKLREDMARNRKGADLTILMEETFLHRREELKAIKSRPTSSFIALYPGFRKVYYVSICAIFHSL